MATSTDTTAWDDDVRLEVITTSVRRHLDSAAVRFRRLRRMALSGESPAFDAAFGELSLELANAALLMDGREACQGSAEVADAVENIHDKRLGAPVAAFLKGLGTAPADARCDKAGDLLERLEKVFASLRASRFRTTSDATRDRRDRRWDFLVFFFLVGLFAAYETGLVVAHQIAIERRAAIDADLITTDALYDFKLGGLEPMEIHHGASTPYPFRWAEGPRTLLVFTTPKSKDLVLSFTLRNPLHGQNITVTINGMEVRCFADIAAHGEGDAGFSSRIGFRSHKGLNTIAISYSSWNHHPMVFAPGDDRPLAVAFTRLSIHPEN